MNIAFRPITMDDAREIADWTYSPPYDFYNWNPADDPAELLTTIPPFVVAENDQGQVAGFVCFGAAAQVPGGHEANLYLEELLDVGFGLHPELTDRGLGHSFVEAALAFGETMLQPNGYRLTVAAFNIRAIRVYERAGFVQGARFLSFSHKIETEFILMRSTGRSRLVDGAAKTL
jgi:[ribosomal protein S18]-alanine N-acetyltransferase